MIPLTHDEYLALAEASSGWTAVNEEARTLQQRLITARLQLARVVREAMVKGLSVPKLAVLLSIPEQDLGEILDSSVPQSAVTTHSDASQKSSRSARRIWDIPRVTAYLTSLLQDKALTTPEIHRVLVDLGAWQANGEDNKAYDALHNYLTHYRGVYYIQEGDRVRAAKPHEVVSPLQVIQKVATKTGLVNAFKFAEEFTIGPYGGKLFYNYVLTTLNCLARVGLIEHAESQGQQMCFNVRPAKLESLLATVDTYIRVDASEEDREEAARVLRGIIRPDWYFEICESTQRAGRGLPPNRTARRQGGAR
jgi:hypothetical protein